MDSIRKLSKRMAEERLRLLTETVEGEPSDFEARLNRLKMYHDLLEYLPLPWYRRFGLPMIVAILSVFCVGLLWTMPKTPTRILISIEASGVQMTPMTMVMVQRSLDSVIGGQRLWASGVGRIKGSPGLMLPMSAGGSDVIHLCQGHFILDELVLSPGASSSHEKPGEVRPLLEIQVFQKETPRIYLKNLSFQADFRLWGDVYLPRGPCGATSGDHRLPNIPKTLAETLRIEGSAQDIQPIELTFTITEGAPIVFRGINLEALHFVREISIGEGKRAVVSTIRNGEISFLDRGSVERLQEMSFLTLNGFRGSVREMQIREGVNLSVEGTAKSVFIGPEGYQRDITPSYLEYLQHNKQFSLLWAAAVFIWGLLWSAKRLLAL